MRPAPFSLCAMNGISAIPSAMSSAVTAINRSQSNLAGDAAVVANPSQPISADTLGALIDSRQQVLYTAAAAKLISASDAVTQSIIDITA
jgi:hypothetical protein